MTKNHLLENNLCLSVFLFVFICVFVPTGARAAVLYIEPFQGQYQPGDIFSATIRIDNEDECVNAVEVNLKFPQNFLEAVDFQDGESILVFWVKRPEIKNDEGMISFIGGIPGGYCGKLRDNSGFTDILGKAIFKVRETGLAQIFSEFGGISAKLEFSDSRVLENDGIGTEAELVVKPAEFKIKKRDAKDIPEDKWYNDVAKNDKIIPEPFYAELTKDILPQEEKKFIVFSGGDKQSGIDRYEILESDPEGNSFATGKKAVWKIAQSPYFLEDQNLQSIIKVKATDNAGNERIAEYGFINACSTLMLI